MEFLLWQQASLAFFAYILTVLAARRRDVRAAGWVLTWTLAGIAAVLGASLFEQPVLATWIWPPAVLLISYWASGLLFVAPSASQERLLSNIDRSLRICDVSRQTPRLLGEVLEAAYLGVYALVPIALVLHLWFADAPDPVRFWNVVLVTGLICFGVLPWVQTRPPRALEGADPWPSRVRALNISLLGSTSIQVNTFPSGHAAQALAAALLSLAAPLPVVVAMFTAAAAVSAGAVLGRYHYAADAIAGWLVALSVWSLLV